MAKKFVKISLATKLRLLFAVAIVGILAAALIVPWYFLELLAEQNILRCGEELTRLRVNEWIRFRQHNPAAASDAGSILVAAYAENARSSDTKGPFLITLTAEFKPDRPLDSAARKALAAFLEDPGRHTAIVKDTGQHGRLVYRCFRAVRVGHDGLSADDLTDPTAPPPAPGQLVGLVDVALPASGEAGQIVLWTRGAFLGGLILATVLATVLFTAIAQRLILRPVRALRNLADRVAEGDLTSRSTIQTDDELQRLGDSFNEMLEAIVEKHERLRAANRALDLKLNELGEANVTLYQANQVKDEFLANVSHELRTPLNSVLGFANLLSESDDERVRRYGENITRSASDLLTMINDLLDLAKIEAGRAQVNFDKLSLLDTCQTLAALMTPLADNKEITFTSELPDQLPIIVSDAGKLQQVLYNLLSNAIKFTPVGGRVTLSAGLVNGQADEPGKRKVYVAVADNGPGIAPADQQHIFEKFYQLDKTLTKSASGTGLGLAISKELTALLGGQLVLDSEPGHGSTFKLILPMAPPQAEAEHDADESA